MRAAAIAFALAACSANDDIPAPQIANVVPDHAPAGQVVVVNGSYFCQRPQGGSDEDPNCTVIGTVAFGGVPASPVTWTDSSIMVEVPQTVAGRADVQITAAGRTSNSIAFTVD